MMVCHCSMNADEHQYDMYIKHKCVGMVDRGVERLIWIVGDGFELVLPAQC